MAALSPLLLVSDRWRPLRPRILVPLDWTASGVLVLMALWQLAVAFAVESQTYMSSGTAQTVWGLTFAPLFAIPALMTTVTWSYARRHRTRRLPRSGQRRTMPNVHQMETHGCSLRMKLTPAPEQAGRPALWPNVGEYPIYDPCLSTTVTR
ncbi:hypothetical protein [Streptomyces sp. B1I3]|uniref:hypothetical protein n=1 Tax=Streptomyces sp. B1I3 TaxID=3042264 RepID=UPI00278885E1|nr:hypothetical protein [Streptomyces sp. B1I3]MDQ0791595.1 hypothetical protein [Streptomyces sp. B1I3]